MKDKFSKNKKNKNNKKDEKVDMYSFEKSAIISINLSEAVQQLYYLKVRPGTDSELKSAKSKFTSKEVKVLISEQDLMIPLYDVYTSNIYIIQRRNVYSRVINNHYRFPDSILLKTIREKKEKMDKKLIENPKSKSDLVFMKRHRKAELMLQFMEYFDLDILFNTYLRVFYLYAPEISNQTYTCLRKSFIPHKNHLLPYYTKDEVIKLAMNNSMIKIPNGESYEDYKDKMTNKDYADLCNQIQKNDVSADTLIIHQNYIIRNNAVGLVQYYTVQGSYFINQYMRLMTSYEYKNDYLENIIAKMWKLVLNAPSFDKDYVLYRFISDDSYLKKLKVGDIYSDPGFTSTTRDPFYRTDLYQFGFILIKVRIPKGVKGVGLCLETLSHFPHEEEIILPPMAQLKLVDITDASDYYHPDVAFASEVKKSYVFEWVSNIDKTKLLPFPARPEYPEETKLIDFLELPKPHTLSLRERISQVTSSYFDPMNRIRCKIGSETFYVIGEYYDSTGPYEPMYALTTSEGFSLYSIYNGYMLFMIEIGEENNDRQIRVNYFSKYSELKRGVIMGDDNFIEFISSIAYYFDIPNVVIYADYHSCDHLSIESDKNSQIGGFNTSDGSMKTDHKLRLLDTMRRKYILSTKQIKQRKFAESISKVKKIPNIADDKDLDTSLMGLDDTDDLEYTGGSYCIDFYEYLKNGTKRYSDTDTLNIELWPNFDYRDLDIMRGVAPSSILSPRDRDEMYQIYYRAYLVGEKEDLKKHSLADLYIWMIENKCYLMDIFVAKLDRLFKKRNPFKKGYYILDSMTYLYNRSKIESYSRFIKMNFDEDYQLLVLPKNEYRIDRNKL